ncbi:MAG TPA: hypothetical protein VFC46_14040, partial [Humisphaera sp.]|nr:hypothetical protein [Humisphaera sp.]
MVLYDDIIHRAAQPAYRLVYVRHDFQIVRREEEDRDPTVRFGESLRKPDHLKTPDQDFSQVSPRINDDDGQARAPAKELDKVAFWFVAQRGERDIFREKSRKTAVVGIEVETSPLNGVLFEPAAECAQGCAFAHVPPGLHGNDETMMDGFHGIWLQGDAPRFPSRGVNQPSANAPA